VNALTPKKIFLYFITIATCLNDAVLFVPKIPQKTRNNSNGLEHTQTRPQALVVFVVLIEFQLYCNE